MACGDLIKSLVLDCENIMQPGVGGSSRVILIQKSDLSAYTVDGEGKVTALTLVSNKAAYSIDGVRQSAKPKFERVASPAGASLYKHQVELFYFGYSQVDKNNVTRLANGRYIVIYENAKQDANAWEILGLDAGLEVTEMMRAPQENGAAIRIVLASAENEFEAKPPRTFLSTDYAASKTALEALLYLPTITTFSPTAAAAAGGTAITITGTNYFGGGPNNAVTKVEWVNRVTGAVVNQSTFTVASNTSITLSTVAMAAGTYGCRVTTTKGVVTSDLNLIVS
jgi:hypothetical protein